MHGAGSGRKLCEWVMGSYEPHMCFAESAYGFQEGSWQRADCSYATLITGESVCRKWCFIASYAPCI